MALGRDIVDAIIREHSYRPIAGDVLVIGHQTVHLSRNEVLELMREHGVAAPDTDPSPIGRQSGAAAEDGMSAANFFRLLGVDTVRTLDAANADTVQDKELAGAAGAQELCGFHRRRRCGCRHFFAGNGYTQLCEHASAGRAAHRD